MEGLGENNYILAFPLDLWVMDADGSNERMILHNGFLIRDRQI